MNSVLTDAEKAQFVTDIADYGADFVAPLFAVVESIEQAVLQSPEVQAWKRDAQRYHWLREQPNDTEAPRIDVVYWVPSYDVNEGEGMRSETLDAAIDAAMEKQP